MKIVIDVNRMLNRSANRYKREIDHMNTKRASIDNFRLMKNIVFFLFPYFYLEYTYSLYSPIWMDLVVLFWAFMALPGAMVTILCTISKIRSVFTTERQSRLGEYHNPNK